MVMDPMPMPIPMIAVSSGSPAATNDPNVIMSTMAATPTPITSAGPAAEAASSASPPISALIPWARARSTIAVSCVRDASVRSVVGTR
jgi:mannose/fructose/N-acetylgalactosamine-specific phosphotransferase system component IIC